MKSHVEKFSYDDAVVRKFAFATIIWGAVATLAGLWLALMLVVPALSFDLPQLTFGRLRPLHTNAAIFAFAGNALFAAIYYSSQRLLKARMFSDGLSNFHFWGWQAIIVSAALTIPFGITQSKEYARVLVSHVVPGNFSIRVGGADDVRVAQRPPSEGAGGSLLSETLRQL
jgi:cytochrome c oxidase cbb3-type subunit I/II